MSVEESYRQHVEPWLVTPVAELGGDRIVEIVYFSFDAYYSCRHFATDTGMRVLSVGCLMPEFDKAEDGDKAIATITQGFRAYFKPLFLPKERITCRLRDWRKVISIELITEPSVDKRLGHVEFVNKPLAAALEYLRRQAMALARNP